MWILLFSSFYPWFVFMRRVHCLAFWWSEFGPSCVPLTCCMESAIFVPWWACAARWCFYGDGQLYRLCHFHIFTEKLAALPYESANQHIFPRERRREWFLSANKSKLSVLILPIWFWGRVLDLVGITTYRGDGGYSYQSCHRHLELW